jgi:hypothetical protein
MSPGGMTHVRVFAVASVLVERMLSAAVIDLECGGCRVGRVVVVLIVVSHFSSPMPGVDRMAHYTPRGYVF